MSEIYECTKDHPWAPGKTAEDDRVRHHDTREIGEQEGGWPGGDVITVECRNCGIKWREELPQ